MVGQKTIEQRVCTVCRRKTVNVIQRSKNGVGRILAEIAKCQEHCEWAGGRIELRDAVTGDWLEVRQPRDQLRGTRTARVRGRGGACISSGVPRTQGVSAGRGPR